LPEVIPGSKFDARRKSAQPDDQDLGEEDQDTTIGGGRDFAGGVGGQSETDGEKGEGAGGESGDSSRARGGLAGIRSKPSIPIQYRTFAVNAEAGVYAVTVRAQAEAKPAAIIIWTVGDDQRTIADIKTVRLPKGEELPLIDPGVVSPIKLPTDSPIRFEVVLREPIRVAMEVSAHEA
jgi:hypothetical protein